MLNQVCAICELANFRVLYKENFDIKKIDEKIFSARRLPDRVHYQIVKCRKCDLIYSTPILEPDKIAALYKKSFVDYDAQVENLIKTYGYYLNELKQLKLLKQPKDNTRLLEIGCGSGFFLSEARRLGFKNVYGVEPGRKSVEKAPSKIRKNIKVDIFRPGLFKKDFFDVICCFQTFDHIPDPNSFLKECHKILKKGGLMLFLNHDAEALSAKLMGERSPIIDIEHTFLYSKKTMRRIFEKHKFKVLSVQSAFNIHSLAYWAHLAPQPGFMKIPILKFLNFTPLGNIRIKLNPGNLVIFAGKS